MKDNRPAERIGDAASAGRIDTRVIVAPGQRQYAEAGAKALYVALQR